jgi:hypothetical protein
VDKEQDFSICKIAQKLISYGHSWLSIQQYSLSEIGVFLREVVYAERAEQAAMLYATWAGTKFKEEEIKKLLNKLQDPSIKQKPKELSPEEIQDNWQRLAAFMHGKK